MTPYYTDDSVTLYHGDALAVIRDMPDGSVDCIVTSPPYFGLRDYGVEGQLGVEDSPAEYVARMVELFSEARRVLAEDGTFWLNLGDSYAANGRGGLPAKNLLGMPWRVALDLQDDGWILRNEIIWAKPNAMPESVTDRLSTKHEHLFMFAKSPRYWFDLNAIREPLARPEALDEGIEFGGKHANNKTRRGNTYGKPRKGKDEKWNAGTGLRPHEGHRGSHEAGRNPGDVWSIPTQPYSGAHFAVMPQTLASRCIQAGCKPGGTVLDPFSGSGTTGLAAAKHARKYVGIDLNADYLDLSLRTRLAQTALIADEIDAYLTPPEPEQAADLFGGNA